VTPAPNEQRYKQFTPWQARKVFDPAIFFGKVILNGGIIPRRRNFIRSTTTDGSCVMGQSAALRLMDVQSHRHGRYGFTLREI
jgi:hypothetical protein